MKIGLKMVGEIVALVDLDSGEPVTNVAAWVWGKGCSLNGKFAGEEPDEVIRSWPEAGEGDLIFDDQLYAGKEYLLVAVPCSAIEGNPTTP